MLAGTAGGGCATWLFCRRLRRQDLAHHLRVLGDPARWEEVLQVAIDLGPKLDAVYLHRAYRGIVPVEDPVIGMPHTAET